MTPIEHQFHHQQKRLRCQGGKPRGVKGQSAVAPLFSDLFTGLDAKDNDQRIAEYEQKMARYTGVAA